MNPADLPLALGHLDRFRGRDLALFLDYDGVLAPIVEDPLRAQPAPEMQQALEAASARWPVAIVTGRDLATVRRLLGSHPPPLTIAANHGFQLWSPERGDL
ncbi:MAG: HAD-IIB family hydrolase, partial [Candidatus Dormibacteraeota bacterium]|nr:HAD-IIB family hydrolase [Candidatus Dormibacteraeota bacterium]